MRIKRLTLAAAATLSLIGCNAPESSEEQNENVLEEMSHRIIGCPQQNPDNQPEPPKCENNNE